MIGLLLLPIVLLLLVRWFERATTFQPFRNLESNPGELGRPFEELFLNSGAAKIHAWHFPAATNAAHSEKVFLVCHGNAGNIGHRLSLASTLLQTGAGVLLFDYRGYGRSTGKPSEKGLYEDARAAHGFLIGKGYSRTNIILFGESLGGAVAVELAASTNIGGVILLSSFTSIPDMGADLFPWIPRWLGSLRFNSLERIPQVQAPVLIIHSRADTIVGFHHAQKLFEAANHPKALKEINADHNDTFVDAEDDVREAVAAFLER